MSKTNLDRQHPARALRTLAGTLSLLGCVVLVSACASAPPATQTAQAAGGATAQASEGRVVCRNEAPTGMRIPITTCRRVAEIEKRSDNDRDWANNIPTEVPEVGRGR